MSTVHVFGAAGFAGAQLAALVDAHPHFALGAITARGDAGRRLVEVAPEYRVQKELTPPDASVAAEGDFAAVCYPHATAAPLVAELLDRGVRVVDVSADHRLRDPELYPAVYGFEHPRPDLLEEAVYGLPERYRDRIATARLVGNPGCYPEASILALLPLAGGLADVVVDAKSGVSGAGKTPTETVHYSSVADSISAYKVYSHRHTPEIEQELGVPVLFQPHLVPHDQGEMVSCYVRLTADVDVHALYEDRYADEPFVELAARPPGMRDVRETNICRIHVHPDERSGRVLVFAVIDNLWKGTASQAIQSLNLMLGMDETTGLLP
jgi:N-acetyl-gamma-glutamyl-phosphate reductase